MRKKLGVNIDHIATIRQARKENYPDPVQAAVFAELGGADSITVHLREDRRHICERDIYLLRDSLKIPMNLEMALSDEILEIALKIAPEHICVVPERREELTTEGGLDVIKYFNKIKESVPPLKQKGVEVSLFIEPVREQIEASRDAGAQVIEIHTGKYAQCKREQEKVEELNRIVSAVSYAHSIGLKVNAGHGLHYYNTYDIAIIPEIEVLNIGHSIISRAVLIGLKEAVFDMKKIIDEANAMLRN